MLPSLPLLRHCPLTPSPHNTLRITRPPGARVCHWAAGRAAPRAQQGAAQGHGAVPGTAGGAAQAAGEAGGRAGAGAERGGIWVGPKAGLCTCGLVVQVANYRQEGGVLVHMAERFGHEGCSPCLHACLPVCAPPLPACASVTVASAMPCTACSGIPNPPLPRLCCASTCKQATRRPLPASSVPAARHPPPHDDDA